MSAADAVCELRRVERAHWSTSMRWPGRSLRLNGAGLIDKGLFRRGSNCRSERAAPWPIEERQGRRAWRYCDVAMVIMTCRF